MLQQPKTSPLFQKLFSLRFAEMSFKLKIKNVFMRKGEQSRLQTFYGYHYARNE